MEALNKPMLAIVMLGDDVLPSNEALLALLRKRLPQSAIDLSAPGSDKAAIFFIEGTICSVMYFPLPCPVEANEPCFVFAWYWPKAWETLRHHKAHLVLSAGGKGDAKRDAGVLAQLVAATIEAAPSAIGVSWASGDVVWPAKTFAQMVPKASFDPPVPLCVSVRIMQDADGIVRGRTKGLDAFGLMEIETNNYKGAPAKLAELFQDLAGYLVTQGAVIKDGDTVGPDEKTKMLVKHEVSSAVPGTKVYQVAFE